ncbi:outer membrane beta-barrel protein [Altererythrobacter xixiisoli]|uniref:Outer membrane beta-barrel protein n=1 Tax=Croceibacterium xixiisoli TaxID=1476466 RepID=A0A6I4TTI6_9SPHN|nr:porin family protein [Croceibacterium xixiisoli]MXO97918.1 outer membrane beta-barrel protein [Croceibacterium xixiisoli]
MKKIALLAAVAAAAVATPALAHTGPYIGVIAGYDRVSVEAGDETENKGNVAYGVIAGYDYHFEDRTVIGLEVELSDSEVSEGFDGAKISAGHDIYGGIRAGYEVSEGTLVYAKAGYTNARVKYELGDFEDSDAQSGFRVGGGVEKQFANFGLRLEYRYSNYGDINIADEETGIRASRHQLMVGALAKF